MSPWVQSKKDMNLLSVLRTPGHRRSVLVRRVVALLLLLAAAVSAVTAAREQPRTVVLARDVAAGHELVLGDVSVARIPSSALPATALGSDPEQAVGRVLVASAGAGEILTTTRLLSADLVANFGMEEAHLIPITLAEPEIAGNLHHGDTVNIVAGDAGPGPAPAPVTDVDANGAVFDAAASTIATGARVVSVGAAEDSGRRTTLLVALPAQAAETVAAASLARPLTVVIVGDRASG